MLRRIARWLIRDEIALLVRRIGRLNAECDERKANEDQLNREVRELEKELDEIDNLDVHFEPWPFKTPMPASFITKYYTNTPSG